MFKQFFRTTGGKFVLAIVGVPLLALFSVKIAPSLVGFTLFHIDRIELSWKGSGSENRDEQSASAQTKPPQSASPPRDESAHAPDDPPTQGQQICSDENDPRLNLIGAISSTSERDKQYRAFALGLLGCHAFDAAIKLAQKISVTRTRDDLYSIIVTRAIDERHYEPAEAAARKITGMQNRDAMLQKVLTARLAANPGSPLGELPDLFDNFFARRQGSRNPPTPPETAEVSEAVMANCPVNLTARRTEIAKITPVQSRDYEYGTLILESLGCGFLGLASQIAAQMAIVQEQAGAYAKIVMTSLARGRYEFARETLEKPRMPQTRDVLRSIYIAEMGRKKPTGSNDTGTTYSDYPSGNTYADTGYDPSDPDLVQIDYGTLGYGLYNYRTGRLDEAWPCARGRAVCPSQPDFQPYDVGGVQPGP